MSKSDGKQARVNVSQKQDQLALKNVRICFSNFVTYQLKDVSYISSLKTYFVSNR